jgi:hypothetical protein
MRRLQFGSSPEVILLAAAARGPRVENRGVVEGECEGALCFIPGGGEENWLSLVCDVVRIDIDIRLI